MTFGYQSARDFFEAARCAAQELERTERQIGRMRAAEGVKAQRYDVRGSGGGDVHGMGATDSRIDFEERMRRRMEEDRALVARAVDVCYGDDGGVASLVGSHVADALYWRFCRAASWSAVADAVCSSVKTAQRWCDVGLDTVDGVGVRRSIEGHGVAEG